MNFEPSPKSLEWLKRFQDFMGAHVYPAEITYHDEIEAARAAGNPFIVSQVMAGLKAKAREAGLWNLFLVDSPYGAGLTNLEYAPIAEEMGRSGFAAEIFNCSAPDTGNMEVLARYGSAEQQEKWLKPLLSGDMRSAFLMTEPAVASSDATNIETRIELRGDRYLINGTKWWSSCITDPRCAFMIVMGKTRFDGDLHSQQSMIIVPRDTPGVEVRRMLRVFGFDHAPHGHGEVDLVDVEVPAGNIILGEGRGFEIAQGRLGPGRIHLCMRNIGMAERALERMVERLHNRVAFGQKIADYSIWEQRVSEARINIDMARLLTLKAADMMDKVGAKAAKGLISQIKVVAPNVAWKILDDAIQAFGGAGFDDPGIAEQYALARVQRIGDGPDEVHHRTIARLEYRKYLERAAST